MISIILAKDGKLAAQVAFNIMLAHAKAVHLYRKLELPGEIGVVLNLTPSYTRNNSDEDKKQRGMPTCSLIAVSLNRWLSMNSRRSYVKSSQPMIACQK